MGRSRDTADVVESKNQCTAWVRFDGVGTIIDSYNVSAVNKISTGKYEIVFTTPMDNANYFMTGNNEQYGLHMLTVNPSITVSSMGVLSRDYQNNPIDAENNNVIIFGGKA